MITADLKQLIAMNADQVLAQLASTPDGLTNSEAGKRQEEFGKNEITRKSYRSVFTQAMLHAMNPLVAILIAAALISAFTGNIASAVIIITIIIISISLDYIQSHRALVAVKQLQEKIAPTATVCRDHVWMEIPTRELVPGDVIRLSAGDLIPADCVLLKSKDIHVQQAALTGESLPVEKEAGVVSQPQNPVAAANAVFSGSSIISGTATAVVVNTGRDTLFGNIAESLAKAAPRSEFEKGMMRFGAFIMKVVFLLVIFVFSFNIYLQRPLLESLLFAISLAVGLTPELLPMITTVTLAAGAIHMARKKVIVKNLEAIQNFGSIDIL
jgi:P-type Mg2+ transporter